MVSDFYVKLWGRLGALLLAVVLVVSVSFFVGDPPTDDTDFDSAHRSGLVLFTDARTGCQYIGRPLGALTPRMGADGKQVCNAKGDL